MPAVAPTGARGAATAAVGTVVGALVVLPLLRLVQVLWQESGGDLARVLGSADLGAAARNSVALASAVTLAAVPIGVATALVLRRPDLPGRAGQVLRLIVPLTLRAESDTRPGGAA